MTDRRQPGCLEKVLAEVITVIALQACRNGESGDRRWPDLRVLLERDDPRRPGWKGVGVQYAPELMQLIAESLTREAVGP